MTSSYAWIITRDYVTTTEDHKRYAASNGKDGLPSRVGIIGPSDASDEQIAALKRGEGAHWRCLDDDGCVYYHGRFVGDSTSEDGFGPLDDFARPDAGAVEIQYKIDGKWVGL